MPYLKVCQDSVEGSDCPNTFIEIENNLKDWSKGTKNNSQCRGQEQVFRNLQHRFLGARNKG
jgi:hypothetical protein